MRFDPESGLLLPRSRRMVQRGCFMGATQQALVMVGAGIGGTTWSPTDKTSQWGLSNGDRTATWTGASLGSIRSVAGSGGSLKVAWAVRVVSFTVAVFYAGLTDAAQAITSIGSPYLLIQTSGVTLQAGGSGSGATLAAMSANDIYMFAQDGATGETWVGKGGTWSGDPGAGTGEAYTFTSPTDFKALLQSFNNATVDLLTGSDYPYSLPSGFSSL